ncbi:pirin family protein [Marinomonas sp. RSW2]|uniref:Pirin family protein n=1 Tax=Marinomonas maritima TaxID=2940935 RepID=A0ABT5WEC7_9GAMM|nr:pirin family protein [Marinomonas maritima]MDE8603176.1 pirin family protein [Marinomonas maritima]
MQILSRDSLLLGGVSGIKEHRLVTDSRIFGRHKEPQTWEGLGCMVYLADAQYQPKGESGMHPHSEIDVISVIVKGRVCHEGSLEHGKDLAAGDVQVQRAGGEGFEHNEINPDNCKNRMLQVWVLPEVKGQRAAYKFYRPKLDGMTRIYGGDESQSETFSSPTVIDIVHLQTSERMTLTGKQLSYVITGKGTFTEPHVNGEKCMHLAEEGDLVHSQNTTIIAKQNLHMLVVSQQT